MWWRPFSWREEDSSVIVRRHEAHDRTHVVRGVKQRIRIIRGSLLSLGNKKKLSTELSFYIRYSQTSCGLAKKRGAHTYIRSLHKSNSLFFVFNSNHQGDTVRRYSVKGRVWTEYEIDLSPTNIFSNQILGEPDMLQMLATAELHVAKAASSTLNTHYSSLFIFSPGLPPPSQKSVCQKSENRPN